MDFRQEDKKDGFVKKHRSRLVAKLFKQRDGIDNNEIFSSIVQYTIVRAIFALVAEIK